MLQERDRPQKAKRPKNRNPVTLTKSSDSTCPPIRLAKFSESFTSVEPAILFLTNVSGPVRWTNSYTTYNSVEANSLIESSPLNIVHVHGYHMHMNIAYIMSGMRRTNHVTSVQKNSYLKTKPHQKLRLKHYRNWIRWILDDRDKTKWKQFCYQCRNIAVQRGSTTGTTAWPANC